jgi:DNA polymerase-3 subunit epsilon
MKLQLEKPIVFLDIESTGTDREADRIIELSLLKQNPDGSRQVNTFRCNPGMAIPAGSTAVHGISDEDVKGLPIFSYFAQLVMDFIEGCDLAGFNSNNFDIPMLYNELMRCGKVLEYKKRRLIDVGNIFKIKEACTLTAAVKFYLSEEHEGAHGAEADVLATANVLFAQIDKYEDLPQTIDELALFSNFGNKMLDLSGKFSTNKDGVVVLNFGKYKGEPAKDHIDFLQWMVYRANFSQDTRDVALEIMGVDQDDDMPY